VGKESKMMNIEYKLGWRWIVWVGGVDDYFLNYKDAKESYDEWINAGYDFVKIERIEEVAYEDNTQST
jgi:hypothetical protein